MRMSYSLTEGWENLKNIQNLQKLDKNLTDFCSNLGQYFYMNF